MQCRVMERYVTPHVSMWIRAWRGEQGIFPDFGRQSLAQMMARSGDVRTRSNRSSPRCSGKGSGRASTTSGTSPHWEKAIEETADAEAAREARQWLEDLKRENVQQQGSWKAQRSLPANLNEIRSRAAAWINQLTE